jgi:hypothetical protein
MHPSKQGRDDALETFGLPTVAGGVGGGAAGLVGGAFLGGQQGAKQLWAQSGPMRPSPQVTPLLRSAYGSAVGAPVGALLGSAVAPHVAAALTREKRPTGTGGALVGGTLGGVAGLLGSAMLPASTMHYLPTLGVVGGSLLGRYLTKTE